MATKFPYENVIAIDFDHTIHDKANRPPDRRMGPPFAGVKEAIHELRRSGKKVIVLTARTDFSAIQDWLKYFDIYVDDVTNIKPQAEVYIDDRALKFDGDWQTTLNQLKEVT